MTEDMLDVLALLRRYGLRPNKRLGQNFLVDPVALQQVVAAGEISPESIVLEIGPGLGSLTRLLARHAGQVIAVELDQALIPPLEEVLKPFSNVRIIAGDILALDPSTLMAEVDAHNYIVVANIPYYITSALIRRLLEARQRPERVVLTVQKEVAERITAGPGELSLLALSVLVFGKPEITALIPSKSFYPPPEVDSAVVRIRLYAQPFFPPAELDTFFRLAKAGFSQKRKMLRNALAGGLHLKPPQAADLLIRAGIDPNRRAETLALEEWASLLKSFQSIQPLHDA